MTRKRRSRTRGTDRDPELMEALETGVPCAYSMERWCRLTGRIYFGEEPNLPTEHMRALLDAWFPEYAVDQTDPSGNPSV